MRLETVRRTRIVTSWRAAGSSADHGRVERLTFRFTDGCEGEAAGLGSPRTSELLWSSQRLLDKPGKPGVRGLPAGTRTLGAHARQLHMAVAAFGPFASRQVTYAPVQLSVTAQSCSRRRVSSR